mmetsp:Transcript_10373/g.13125  ORF Transcript_10373/g.13125 Transcript_10373/m.13125 type:complete len:280 (-) Transcript_10373:98-937(-)
MWWWRIVKVATGAPASHLGHHSILAIKVHHPWIHWSTWAHGMTSAPWWREAVGHPWIEALIHHFLLRWELCMVRHVPRLLLLVRVMVTIVAILGRAAVAAASSTITITANTVVAAIGIAAAPSVALIVLLDCGVGLEVRIHDHRVHTHWWVHHVMRLERTTFFLHLLVHFFSNTILSCLLRGIILKPLNSGALNRDCCEECSRWIDFIKFGCLDFSLAWFITFLLFCIVAIAWFTAIVLGIICLPLLSFSIFVFLFFFGSLPSFGSTTCFTSLRIHLSH